SRSFPQYARTCPRNLRDMVTLDLASLTVREVNEQLRQFGAEGEDVHISNPDARHHIGVGLTDAITVHVDGSAGYFCAGLSDQAHFKIAHNVGWGVGDNMYSGSVVVGGNSGAIPGVAIRGAEIVIRGNMGSRAGQVMKAGTLCCAGNANFMAGYMMYGGRIIIVGDSGERVGEDMSAGEIFVGGRVQDLGSDAMIVDTESGEDEEIRTFLDRYEISFSGSFTKVINAGKKLRYGSTEKQMRSLPFTVFSGQSEYWNSKVQEDIHIKSNSGRYRIRGYGGARPLPHLSDLAFRRDLSNAGNVADVVNRVSMETQIGGINGAEPLKLSMPVMIAPMSYGALSRSTKQAVAMASAMSGIAENTGEGGMSDAQRDAAGQLIFQCLGGRLGWNIHDMRRADGLEIYISQGAKPGLGGQLMAKKVTAELAEIRGIPSGIDLRSPSRHPDILGADDLVIKVEELREATGYRLPVSIKLGAGRIRDDIKIAAKDGFDFVELDGMQGSTGAGSSEVIDHVGIPTLPAIIEALEALEEIGARQKIELVLMGGLRDGVDAVKALCLGADAAAFGTSVIIAGGCIACMQCHVGQCVTGIATQDPEHEHRYKPESEASNIHRFLESVRWQIAAITHGLGYTDVRELSRDDLVALTPEAAAITGLPYEPWQGDRLPLAQNI
ncbi:MAG: glutamate synthase-related protein, partial [Arenicellales bacterium]|nr:glutamate synthase-related protein [Arenicellales bacterium]